MEEVKKTKECQIEEVKKVQVTFPGGTVEYFDSSDKADERVKWYEERQKELNEKRKKREELESVTSIVEKELEDICKKHSIKILVDYIYREAFLRARFVEKEEDAYFNATFRPEPIL